ncbi:MAG: flagellar biosynthesis protein FlhF [Planctomycetes bacterium]|nr:flagellar biosynthesis protein FlhF [Planctomycetota bacterium]
MDVRTYRAPNMQAALALVRRELGPEAAVLHTREVGGSRLLRWIPGMRQIEVTASAEVNVPSRLPPRKETNVPTAVAQPRRTTAELEERAQFRDELRGQLSDLQSMVEDLCRKSKTSGHHDLPESLFQVYMDLIEAEIAEEQARELIEQVRSEVAPQDLNDSVLVKTRVLRLVEEQVSTSGPISVTPGQRRVVALVGPTGVGKTTTIAKLAANFRLREKRRVGLITVDTYRIAAVEQLRTYAEIIDLPMHVVSTPREMREALRQLSGLDLVLMDTAGRSPRDEVKIQELRAFLTEAQADEVHLVLSAVASASSLIRTAERFAVAATTHLILTKLDEATAMGSLLPTLRSSGLPLSYVTNGQNVPDDIAAADNRQIARAMLAVAGGIGE